MVRFELNLKLLIKITFARQLLVYTFKIKYLRDIGFFGLCPSSGYFLNNNKKTQRFRNWICFRNVVFFHCYLGNIRTMDKVRKPNISVCYTPSSEPYSIQISSNEEHAKRRKDIISPLWATLYTSCKARIIIIILTKVQFDINKIHVKTKMQVTECYNLKYKN
jgi:hypothetical protein